MKQIPKTQPTKPAVSAQTRRNWLIDFGLFTSAMTAMLSGIYFLYLPNGGYRGGRNPMYNVQIIFNRNTWDDLHTWGGVVMIAIATIHLAIHWKWVAGMARRTWNELTGKSGSMNRNGRWNLILNALMGLSFVLTAVSGIYFLFVPSGRSAADPMILFARSTWDVIHTWAGVSMISLAVLHFAVHWKWVTKVTHKLWNGIGSGLSNGSQEWVDQRVLETD